ncbi:MAG TPA: hypothetical protein VIY10_03240 [Solirubrobacteraceae bacterium]
MTKQDGIRLREERRARVRRIRARVIGGSVALFLAVWMLITVVLVTGHDPALARKSVTQSATQSATPVATTSSSTSSTSSGATSSSTGSDSSGVSAVTSSQS